MRISLHDRLWSKIDVGYPEECWEWLAFTNAAGYGTIRINGRSVLAHRAVFACRNGEAGEADVLHSCDNPPCCNPDHLRAGTAKDNAQDMMARHRHIVFRNPHYAQRGDAHWVRRTNAHPCPPIVRRYGSDNPQAKLTQANVDLIRERLRAGLTLSAIATEFGVSVSNISKIKTGRGWKANPRVKVTISNEA